jgi:type II secretory pathway pseudopilin PulG
MLVLVIAAAVAASLLVELGLMVVRDQIEASQFYYEDERQMNKAFKRTSGGAW